MGQGVGACVVGLLVGVGDGSAEGLRDGEGEGLRVGGSVGDGPALPLDPRTPTPVAEEATGGGDGRAGAFVGCGTVANVLNVGTRVGSEVGPPGFVPQ